MMDSQHLPFKESILAHHFLDGLNGVEIGASTQNSFGLHRTGAHANIGFDYTQGAKWQSDEHAPTIVNIVASPKNLSINAGATSVGILNILSSAIFIYII